MSPTILICEDDEQLRRLIATVLSRSGYELRLAANGQAALDDLDVAVPDLAILDVHMPGIGGLAVLKRIREDPALAATRVLLVSGTRDAHEPDWGRRLGADAHLAKPFAITDLDASVRSLLEG